MDVIPFQPRTAEPVIGRVTVNQPGKYELRFWRAADYDALPEAERVRPAFPVGDSGWVLAIVPVEMTHETDDYRAWVAQVMAEAERMKTV